MARRPAAPAPASPAPSAKPAAADVPAAAAPAAASRPAVKRAAPRRPRKRASPPPPTPLARIQRILRRGAIAARDLAIGLVLIGAISFLPETLTATWSHYSQRAVLIARDIRVLLFDASTAMFGALGIRWRPGLSGSHLPAVPRDESAVRAALFGQVHADRRVTFFCGCVYDARGQVDLASCGLAALSDSTRAARLEAERVVSLEQIGAGRPCWSEPSSIARCTTRQGGLLSSAQCCARVDPHFVAAGHDLHNRLPAVGVFSAARASHAWGELTSGPRLSACAIRLDPILRRVEPPAPTRGDIARIILYMRDTYGLLLAERDERLYADWNNADPPDASELERNRRIRRLQGLGNHYVEDYRWL
ncbi:MAG: deoxyribonuclease I [Sphingobacteriia bacterium]|nr:deoxyribonuclease I [Sphingobacteriia bacterium]NCC38921.1 deoxyribonuclease I [Gammaproteobacteria bacterium]